LTDTVILRASNIHRGFDTPQGRLEVLKGVDLALARGEMAAVLGVSGVGKSTLLHILGGLDRPDNGTVAFGDTKLSELSETELARFRNRYIGFVFQFHYLLDEFTALENVMMPMIIAGQERRAAQERAELLLEEVSLTERKDHRPGELSGGEKQRVAVARALALEPEVVIADEPSGNLDTETAEQLHDLLADLNTSKGTSFLIATHNQPLAARANTIVRLVEGKNRTQGPHSEE
jgi:lipoprotein-releasing system ATP-binding protein